MKNSGTEIDAAGERKKTQIKNGKGTILVQILSRRNATWQGTVTWVERNESINFRSALELLKIIDSSYENKNENEKVFKV